MRRLALAIVTTTVLFIGGLGLQPASAAGYPPCTITGTAANEAITGTEGNDVICTGGGNDTVNALGGNDIIIVTAPGVDTINAGSGSDTIDATLGTDSTIDAGSGDDTVYGSPGDDEITAGDGSDSVDGNAGDDTITGGDGNDDLSGDSGNDTVTGDTGDDTITGGDGNDTINGTAGDDSLLGGIGEDNLNGGDGNDDLQGNAGDDNLYGQTGMDTISGSAGDDIMAGGLGIDQLEGGSGLNICDYDSGETHTSTCKYDDFAPSVISLSFDKSSVEVGSSSATLNATVHLTDESGVAGFTLGCWNSGGNVFMANGGGSGKDSTVTIPVVVDFGKAPGAVDCGVYPSDILGHSSSNPLNGADDSRPYFTVIRTPAGQPSAPISLAYLTTNPTMGILTWVTPIVLGSPSMYSYVTEYSTDGSSWLKFSSGATAATSIPISGLKPDSDYWFRVRGENGGTIGQETTFMSLNWAEIKVHTTSAVAPSAPFSFSSSQVSKFGYKLNWSVPTDNGGSIITDFTVEVSRDNGQSWKSVKSGVSTSTSLTVSGAAPGTTYLVRVAAVNAVGQSEWLMGSVTTLVATATAPKSLASSNLTGTSVSLGWGLPDSNGGSAITDYQVEVTSNGSNSWTVIPHTASNSLGFNVSNLLAGRTYQFRVSAVTSAGVGAASNIGTVTTLGAVGPNAPASLVVSGVKTTSASLSWPGVVATQKVSNYVVDVSTDGSTWISVSKKVSTSTSLALSGLKLGTSYQVRVAAVNSVGTGAYVYVSFTTLATVSTAPTALVSPNVSSSGFTLNWTAPSSNGGAAITDYVVEINGGGFSWSPISHDITGNTSITVTGLNPGIKYSVRVKGVNRVGMSKSSTTLYVTTLPTAPGTVSGLTVKSVTATSAAITWTAPNTGGAKISDYLAEYSTDNGQTWKTVVKSASSSTSLTLKGLKAKTSYLFRVTAKNSVGFSAVSQSLNVTTS